MQSELDLKIVELETLKKSYEEFIESSTALEKELEDSLKESENKCADLQLKKQLAEEKYNSLREKYNSTLLQFNNCQKELSQSTEKLLLSEQKKTELERLVDELQEMVRILETTEEDLVHKLQSAEEELVFKQSDYEELKIEKMESERRLKAELTELQAELAKYENNSVENEFSESKGENEGMHSSTQVKSDHKNINSDLVDELELEIEDLTERLASTELQNQQLNEEVSRLADELIQIHEKHSQQALEVAMSQPSMTNGDNRVLESEEELSIVRNTLQRTEELLEKVRGELDETLEALKIQQTRYQMLEEKYSMLELSLEASNNREKVLENEVSLLSARLLDNESSLSSNTTKNGHIESNLFQSQINVEKTQSDKNHLESELQQQIELIDHLKKKMNQLESELEDLKHLKLKQEDENDRTLNTIKNDSNIQTPTDSPNKVSGELMVEKDLDVDFISWEQEKAGLLREIEFLRNAVSKPLSRHSTPYKSSLDPVPDVLTEVNVPVIILDSAESTKKEIDTTIASGDIEKIKKLLISKTSQLEAMRSNNARLLQKLQAARGNIQVCCRARPPNTAELSTKTGSKVVVEVIDDNELTCYDRRSDTWRSFVFDRVWRMDSSQADIFADVEPLVLSVLEGYNTCLFAYGQTGSGTDISFNNIDIVLDSVLFNTQVKHLP
jgi:chromosome segregation ATPase